MEIIGYLAIIVNITLIKPQKEDQIKLPIRFFR
jgi:hypothetical protein